MFSVDKTLNLKGLIMIKEDPEETVRDEQNGAINDAAGTYKAEIPAEADAEAKAEAEEEEKNAEGENGETVKKELEISSEEVETSDDDIPSVKTEENPDVARDQAEGLTDLDDIELPPVDYSGYSKSELVETLGLIIDNRPPSEIRDDVERIKTLFYKKLKNESEERKTKFLEGGGKIEDYKIWVDPLDYRVKELLDKYRDKKNDYNKIQEAEKYENLKKKYDIIDRIKDLVNREESINKTFHEFRTLQNDWHSIGVVPQSSLKDLWENYHHSVEIFYDYIKINKELRDLDLRKNLELKVLICEKAEELMLEPNPVNAFRILQDLHNQWREIGPVPQESKNEIWERFREATSPTI